MSPVETRGPRLARSYRSTALNRSEPAARWVGVRLERRGETLTAFHSLDGDAWTEAGEEEILGLPETLLAGAAACKGTATAASGPQALQAVITDLALEVLPQVQPCFRRGDANDDGAADISDAIFILSRFFLGGEAPGCMAAVDANGDGGTDLSDAVYSLGFLFLGDPPPPPPFPGCGPGTLPTDEALGCETPPRRCANP
ncbi:MAG: hypothetical protein JXA57_07830 [Armatimonadetes bacterium]|nr:hypothetical protein [Armatimonadota bacterium]